jgi:wyosine [tRNA(Phe)-imidazoG37] synthetase (radical SAM superfamily)
MTITANELLQLFDKVQTLGYTYERYQDVYGGYTILIRYWDKRKTTVELYINQNSDRWNNNDDKYAEFNEVMEDLDNQLEAKVIDKEKEERFKQYQQLKKEFDKEKEERFKQYQQQLKKELAND